MAGRHERGINIMKELFTKSKLKKIEKLAKQLIVLLGDDPERPGMVDTPKRFAKACAEWFEGMQYTNTEIAEMFNKVFDEPSDDLQIKKDIKVFSHCEHHIALMYDMDVIVGYIPYNNKVIGLSKISRICEMAARRFQLQERLCTDIAEIIHLVTGSDDVIVIISGKHSCETSRGVKKASDGRFTSSHITGRFKTNPMLRQEFYMLAQMQ